MKNFKSNKKSIALQMSISMAIFLTACGGGSSTSLPVAPQIIGTAVSAQAPSGARSTSYSLETVTPDITVTGINAGDVAPVLTGGGSIHIVNNGAHVAATQTGTGSISITNNGQVMAATNTGTGIMTINNTNTGAVAVTNTGNGNITVNATGTTPLALIYSDGLDHVYPIAAPVVPGLGTNLGSNTNPNIVVSGSAAANVAAVVSGGGSITVLNNGAHVAATQTGTGALNITNNGQVMAATNTGTGIMTINSTDTGAVAVTRTGNGNTTVTASGTTPLALTFNGDGDVTYPTISNGSPSSLVANDGTHITVSGSAAINVAPVVTGGGAILVVNNGAHVAATQTGTGTLSIVNNGGVLTATNTGTGLMTINSNATAAVTITNASGTGNITVNATGSSAITCTYIDGLNHNDIADAAHPSCQPAPAITAGLGSSIGNTNLNPNVVVSGSNAGAVTTTVSGGGFINVINNGAGGVTATETGTGTITIVNNTGAAGLTATNTGNGLMTITSSATGAVTVTNTGNGNLNVTATGSAPITITHNGDDNFTYPPSGSGSSFPVMAPLSLGAAGAFAILSKTGITDTGGSNITGSIGASPIANTAILVTCPEVNGGAVNSVYGVNASSVLDAACYATNDVTTASVAVADMTTAYNDAANGTSHPAGFTELGNGNIGGMTLAPGTYKWSTVLTIPVNVTLHGGPNDVWIFQVAGGITQTGNVLLTGGAVPANVFWQSAGVVAIGAGATMNGVVLSQTGITLGAAAIVHGKLLSQTNVTLIGNTVSP